MTGGARRWWACNVGRAWAVVGGFWEQEGEGLVYSREQQGASSGHLFVREQVVSARTVDAWRRSVSPMGRSAREETISMMVD